MITKIVLDDVNSYKTSTSLTTDKKINLIYGLNGTGKSTLSDYLYDRTDSRYHQCSIEGLSDDDILVYNQKFIKDYFYQPDNLKSIFTLSKENKEAETKIKSAEQEIEKLEKIKTDKMADLNDKANNLDIKKEAAIGKTWEIKTSYTGGDRVLEFCLDKLKSDKSKLFEHISGIKKPDVKPQFDIDYIKKEVEKISGFTSRKYDLFPLIDLSVSNLENDPIFNKSIVGNENSTISALIKKLGNSDWVRAGLGFIPKDLVNGDELCPFCQQRTISSSLVENIRNYFDENYDNDLKKVKTLQATYESKVNLIPTKELFESNPFVVGEKQSFDNVYNAAIVCLNENKQKISEKIKTPSQSIPLTDSAKLISELNKFINFINIKITEHNKKIDHKENELSVLKNHFWDLMRWNYDQTISLYANDARIVGKHIFEIQKEVKNIDDSVKAQKSVIIEQQSKTVNIEQAITNINKGLIELGIDGFYIEKHSNSLYKIVRKENKDNTFESLSEGEKMIISFLYFRELCKGKLSVDKSSNKKIVVIDDPISSLSHIYIFNIGRMIINDFFKSDNYEQIFLLTHSLYFFYEMTITDHDSRKDTQRLFRLTKNSFGSQISEMKYEELQNDYHSYWYIIKDDNQPPALIANCMRNIIEYFFNFIEKRDLSNVFQQSELREAKYQAFWRYINRESHSFGQNIFDIKEFNYADFKEAFRLVFLHTGYEKHYQRMMR